MGFWAGQCNSVLLLFLYGLYCDTALETLHHEHHRTAHRGGREGGNWKVLKEGLTILNVTPKV